MSCSLGYFISILRLSSPDSIIAVRSSLHSFSRWPIRVINASSSLGSCKVGVISRDFSAGGAGTGVSPFDEADCGAGSVGCVP